VEVQFLQYDLPGMESRTNYEIVENSGHICTMVTERGPILPTRITDDLLKQIRGLVKAGDMLVLTGDASNVEDAAIYSKLTLVVKELGVKVFLDASGHYLKEGLSSSPFLIKPNFEELCFIAGRDLKTEAEIVAAMQSLDGFNIPMIAMTWNGNGAIVKNGRDFYGVNPIKVEAINEGGCGDAFLSAIIAGIEKNISIEATLKAAAAVAAAAAESEITAGFDPTRAAELKKLAVVTKIR
jgi:fructose-1-phosphate kinase PfkB-like protein